jgi:hypothetical protein
VAGKTCRRSVSGLFNHSGGPFDSLKPFEGQPGDFIESSRQTRDSQIALTKKIPDQAHHHDHRADPNHRYYHQYNHPYNHQYNNLSTPSTAQLELLSVLS